MNQFERMWRGKIERNTSIYAGADLSEIVQRIQLEDEVLFSKVLIKALREGTEEETVKEIFCKSACHMPHSKLVRAKATYDATNSIEEARKVLEEDFKRDIKEAKQLSDLQLKEILDNGWGAAGLGTDPGGSA